MNKKIDLKSGKNFLYHFVEEIINNLYYNQTWVWCNSCGRRHNMNSDIAQHHSVKPMPIKCKFDEDHCWKYTDKKYFSGVEIYLCADKSILLWLVDVYAKECIICNKNGLESGITRLPYECLNREYERKRYNLTANQFSELFKYLQSIKDLGFEEVNKITGNRFTGEDIGLKVEEYNKKIREIQNIQDYQII